MKRTRTFLLSLLICSSFLAMHGLFASTWTSPDTLSDTADNSTSVSISTNASGASVAAWRNATDGTIVMASRAAGLTSSWSSTTVVSGGGTVQGPEAAINDNGDIMIIWERTDGPNQSIESRYRPAGGSFAAVVILSATGTTSTSQKIAMNNDIAVVVWIRSNLVETNRVTLATAVAEGVNILSAAGQTAATPQVAVDSANNIAAIWNRVDATTTKTAVQVKTRSASGTWAGTATVELSDSAQDASEQQIGLDDSGNPVAIWKRSNGTNDIVQASCWDGNSWTTPANLSPTGETADQLSLAVNGGGSAVAAWRKNTADVTQRVIKAAFLKTLSTCSWTSSVVVSATAGNETEEPKAGVDQFGNAIIIWNARFTNDNDEQIQSRYFLHVGSSWKASEMVVISTRNAGTQWAGSPEIGMGSSGNAVAGWDLTRSGTNIIQAAYFANSYPAFQVLAKRKSDRFLNQTDHYNKLSWSNYTATKPTLYKVWRGTVFMGTISGQDSLKFEDHNRVKNNFETYQMTTINTNGGESFPYNFTVTK